MKKHALRESLRELRQALHEPESVDEGSKALLLQLHDEIESLLELTHDTPERREEAVEGLQANLGRFETEHPQLAAAIGRVSELLAGLGF